MEQLPNLPPQKQKPRATFVARELQIYGGSADRLPDRVSLLIKENIHYDAAGAKTPSRIKSFVCHTTPHSDSTSRRVSYSVRAYHTRLQPKCKYFFAKSVKKYLFKKG